MKDIFNGLPRVYQGYIVAMDFVEGCKRDPQFKAMGGEICRIQSVETGLPVENLKTVVNRIAVETDEYEDWETLRMFFSRRGRPVGWDAKKLKAKKELRGK